MLTYVHLAKSAFLTGRFGLFDHLLLWPGRTGFAGLEDVVGQVKAGMCEKSDHPIGDGDFQKLTCERG